MPAGDRTGPNGRGSMTGRRLGLCSGYDSPGYMQSGQGNRGYGYGQGRDFRGRGGYGRGGYGRGRWNYSPSYLPPHPSIMPVRTREINPEMVIKDLEYQKSQLEYELQMIDKAIDTQKKPKSTE